MRRLSQKWILAVTPQVCPGCRFEGACDCFDAIQYNRTTKLYQCSEKQPKKKRRSRAKKTTE